jgi:type I restriction enzyme S subunit
MGVRPGYKRTEVGTIPETWEVKTLAQIAPLQRGFDLPHSELKDGPFPVVYSNGALGSHERAMARGPGVVTGRSGTLGAVHFVDTDYWPHNTTLWVTRFNGNDERFVYYLYTAIGFERFASGSGVPTLNRNDAHAFRAALPRTRAEQEAIAEALSDADALIGCLEKLIAKKRQIKQGAMQELLTGKTRLPGFSGEWEEKTLGSILKFRVGFPFSAAFFNEEGRGTRVVRNRDLKSDDQILHYWGTFDDAFLVHDGEVLVGMDGEFLPCLWKGGLALLNQRVGRIQPGPGLDRVFAYYSLLGPLKKIQSATAGTTVKHLSHGDVEGIEMAVPTIEEQAAISTYLTDMDTEISALESKLAKARQIKQGMMQELLTGRIRLV